MIAATKQKPSAAPAVPSWLVVWGALLLAVNVPLFVGGSTETLALFPERSLREPWRWLTHPLVHVNAYHFLLDVSVFLWLLHELGGRVGRRVALVALTAAASTLGALLGSADLNQIGFCGLSGCAHGLAVLVGFASQGRARRMGWLLSVGVLGKAAWEAWTGMVLFAGMHAAPVGMPITTCHLGGALGGLLLACIGRGIRLCCAPCS